MPTASCLSIPFNTDLSIYLIDDGSWAVFAAEILLSSLRQDVQLQDYHRGMDLVEVAV